MLGTLHHLQHDLDQARKCYQVALDLDPAYAAAEVGRERIRGLIRLGEQRQT